MNDASEEMTPRERLLAFAAEHRLTIEAEFVPYSQSDNAKPGRGRDKPWPSLNWRLRLLVQPQAPGGAARELLVTPYAAGLGHAPAMQREAVGLNLERANLRERPAREALAAWEIERGKPAKYASGLGIVAKAAAKPITPDLVDVLASLALDSSVLDAGGFEEWAQEYGYDTDSRAAEATYRACLEIALKLRGGLGEAGLQALRDAAQDY